MFRGRWTEIRNAHRRQNVRLDIDAPERAPDVRAFVLNRDQDKTGISGTGIVAEGVQFQDGTVAMRWLSNHKSTAIYESMEGLIAIHGHDGATQIVWTWTSGG